MPPSIDHEAERGGAGVLGAGGGFMIVPALTLFGGLAMCEAIGTSLLVIAMSSLAGVAGGALHAHVETAGAVSCSESSCETGVARRFTATAKQLKCWHGCGGTHVATRQLEGNMPIGEGIREVQETFRETLRLLTWALEELGSACAVLDPQLAVVEATPAADDLTHGALVRGASMVKSLCGDAPQRPIAEALAAGKAVRGAIVRPDPQGIMRTLEVQASPMLREGRRVGWLVQLRRPDEHGAEADAPVLFHGMWTRDPGMKRLFDIVERAARREVSVLVRGPTGSGKELIARAIHALSPRRAGPFRAINCAALPPTLLESELFGHVRGAFTGALKDSPGIFRAAHHGTLFLDEVAEMPLDLQAKLLRVLETRSVIPIGGTEPVDVDVRIVAATHQSLRRAVEHHQFRADLMYRLRVVPIFLPPLVARRGDLELLTDKLIAQLNNEGERRISQVSRAARDAIAGYPWPGNVRELHNALQYAYVIGDGSVLLELELPPEVTGMAFDPEAPAINMRAPEPPPDDETPEARRIRLALGHAEGNRERAAQILGMSRVTLWRRMKALGMMSADEPPLGE